MKRKNEQKTRSKWLLTFFVIVLICVFLYRFRAYFLKINESESNDDQNGIEPVTPLTPTVYYGFSGGGGGGSGGSVSESMTFNFVDLLEETFSHNKGRYVNTDIINQDGEEIVLAVTQTMNDVALQSDIPVSGTLIIS